MSKNFSFSYSKLKNYNVCPKRHYEVDIAKNFVESSDNLDWGNEVHRGIAGAILAEAVGRVNPLPLPDRVNPLPLPDSMKQYQPWVDKTLPKAGEDIHVELKLAMTKDFQPTGWKDWDGAWYRGIVDALVIDATGTVGLARDWKTGKPQHDSRQLMMNSTVIFAHYPKLQVIATKFVWLKENYETPEIFYRKSIAKEWPPVLANVKEMQVAAATANYPPKPGKLCAKWCPVISCPFHGKRYS